MVLVVLLMLCCSLQARSDSPPHHRYKPHDVVPFYANKVGPFHNPSETYRYYSLPFCTPDNLEEKKESLGELLNGDHLVTAPYKLEFLVNKDSELLCKKNLTKEDVSQFRAAVEHGYYTQMYYDDLPIWAFIGKRNREYGPILDEFKSYEYQIFTNMQFDILYNKDRVIEINAWTTQESIVDVTEDNEVDVEFLYSVRWQETNVSFEERMDTYVQSGSLPHHMEIHWFSVMNSCETVLVLVACLAIFYFRKIKKDFNRFADEEEFVEHHEETGWKKIHGDVFRYPKQNSLFAAFVGSGAQLLVLMFSIIVLGVLGVFRPYSRGALPIGLLVVYTVTSAFAGFIAVYLYRQLGGINWVRNLFLTGSVFSGPLFITFCILNTIATKYRASAALPIGTILILLCIYLFGALPLLLFGGIAGRNAAFEINSPCRTTKVSREIPIQPWYRLLLPRMALAGILPFSVIFVELYYLCASIWGHRIYTIYLILLIVAVILLLVTAFVTVALTYFQLAAEDHEWWWRSFLYGGSAGFYLFGYCLYFYYMRTDMYGLLQKSFFFGYMACVSYGVFLMLGTVGFGASLFFLHHIYGSIKCE